MNKEELQKEMGKLERRNQDLTDTDTRLRQEFAKSFGWGKREEGFGLSYARGYKMNWDTPSWEQIFVKVGKLIANRDFYDMEGNVSELGTAIENIEKRLCEDCDESKNCGKHYRSY